MRETRSGASSRTRGVRASGRISSSARACAPARAAGRGCRRSPVAGRGERRVRLLAPAPPRAARPPRRAERPRRDPPRLRVGRDPREAAPGAGPARPARRQRAARAAPPAAAGSAEEVERGRVGPVRVVDRQQQRLLLGERGGQPVQPVQDGEGVRGRPAARHPERGRAPRRPRPRSSASRAGASSPASAGSNSWRTSANGKSRSSSVARATSTRMPASRPRVGRLRSRVWPSPPTPRSPRGARASARLDDQRVELRRLAPASSERAHATSGSPQGARPVAAGAPELETPPSTKRACQAGDPSTPLVAAAAPSPARRRPRRRPSGTRREARSEARRWTRTLGATAASRRPPDSTSLRASRRTRLAEPSALQRQRLLLTTRRNDGCPSCSAQRSTLAAATSAAVRGAPRSATKPSRRRRCSSAHRQRRARACSTATAASTSRSTSGRPTPRLRQRRVSRRRARSCTAGSTARSRRSTCRTRRRSYRRVRRRPAVRRHDQRAVLVGERPAHVPQGAHLPHARAARHLRLRADDRSTDRHRRRHEKLPAARWAAEAFQAEWSRLVVEDRAGARNAVDGGSRS